MVLAGVLARLSRSGSISGLRLALGSVSGRVTGSIDDEGSILPLGSIAYRDSFERGGLLTIGDSVSTLG